MFICCQYIRICVYFSGINSLVYIEGEVRYWKIVDYVSVLEPLYFHLWHDCFRSLCICSAACKKLFANPNIYNFFHHIFCIISKPDESSALQIWSGTQNENPRAIWDGCGIENWALWTWKFVS